MPSVDKDIDDETASDGGDDHDTMHDEEIALGLQ